MTDKTADSNCTNDSYYFVRSAPDVGAIELRIGNQRICTHSRGGGQIPIISVFSRPQPITDASGTVLRTAPAELICLTRMDDIATTDERFIPYVFGDSLSGQRTGYGTQSTDPRDIQFAKEELEKLGALNPAEIPTDKAMAAYKAICVR